MTITLLLFVFFSTSLNSSLFNIYMEIYCTLSKCIRLTLCSYEHHLVVFQQLGQDANSLGKMAYLFKSNVKTVNSNNIHQKLPRKNCAINSILGNFLLFE